MSTDLVQIIRKNICNEWFQVHNNLPQCVKQETQARTVCFVDRRLHSPSRPLDV